MELVLCRNCDDSIECVEGVLWIHRWTEYDWNQYIPRSFRREFCLLDSFQKKHQLSDDAMRSIVSTLIFRAEPEYGKQLIG